MKKRILCLLCAFVLLYSTFGVVWGSAETVDGGYYFGTTTEKTSVLINGTSWGDFRFNDYLHHVIYPECGNISYKAFYNTYSGSISSFGLRVGSAGIVVPAGKKVDIRFLVLANKAVWDDSSFFRCILMGGVADVFGVTTTNNNNENYYSDLVWNGSGLGDDLYFRFVNVRVDNSSRTSDLSLNTFMFDWTVSDFDGGSVSLGVSGFLLR